MEPAIKVENVFKVYPLYQQPIDRFKEALHPLRRKYHQDFFALKNVYLEVRSSECVGLIGMNGSGKSTLLQIIAGVVSPTLGTSVVRGRMATLLELGAGFNPEATGEDNCRFQCALHGISPEATEAVLDAIYQFADIGPFVHQPVKTYSSGMFVRLAFAAAIAVDPDILIIDEALAVGDSQFQSKCLARIQEFRQRGKSLLFVSHDAAMVKSICDRAYLLHQGMIRSMGSAEQILLDYSELLVEQGRLGQGPERTRRIEGAGGSPIAILASRLKNQMNLPSDTFHSGETVTLEIDFQAKLDASMPDLALSIQNRMGLEIFSVRCRDMGLPDINLQKDGSYRLSFSLELRLGQDAYSLQIKEFLHPDDPLPMLRVQETLVFRVLVSPLYRFVGSCRLDASVSITTLTDLIN